MKNIKHIAISLILFVTANQCFAKGDTLKPVERYVGRLHMSIDPRMELLATVQLLSNYPVIDRKMAYSKEILRYFKSFSKQKAVKMTDFLVQKHGFGYDAPVTFMLHLSQLPELKQDFAFSDYLSGRSGGSENLENYRKHLKQFAKKSNFKTFFNSKIAFYNQILDMTIDEMIDTNLVEKLENYFNENQNSYNVIISPAFKGGYGGSPIEPNKKQNIYASISNTHVKDNIPYVNENTLVVYVWHEFGHSFVNPLTEKHADRVSASEKLFEPIEGRMRKQAYTSWETCVNEHIIRAIVVRLHELHVNSYEADDLLNEELNSRFVYIEPIIEKLKDFEKQRDENNITFSEFYPQLLDLFDSLNKAEYWKEVNIFKGTINDAFNEDKIACIYPTQDTDIVILKKVQDYVREIFDKFENKGVFGKESVFLADTTALKTDLSKYGLMAYGTIESNAFLNHYASTFPFKIENETIYADEEYTNPDIKFITCLPNPQNQQRGMVIYTAISNKTIFSGDIMNVRQGMQDYILFFNRANVKSEGFYNKNEKWEFNK